MISVNAWIYRTEKSILTLDFVLGQYTFLRLINPCIDLIKRLLSYYGLLAREPFSYSVVWVGIVLTLTLTQPMKIYYFYMLCTKIVLYICGQPLEFRRHSYFVDFTSLPAFIKVEKTPATQNLALEQYAVKIGKSTLFLYDNYINLP